MAVNKDLLGPCGLYCGVCAIYIAHNDNNDKLKEKLVNLYKGGVPGKGTLPGSENLTVKDIRCSGCMSDDVFIYCRRCEIKDCTDKKGYTGCHECRDFPCGFVDNFSMTIGKKVMLRAIPYWREMGTEKFVETEEARYICSECGNKVFRGVVRCNKCSAELDLD